jgi:ABC-type antimicrobial peptide transport system permease subunit
MIRTPERFAFVVLMLCLIAVWAGFLPFDMNQMFVAYTIFWVAWSAWTLLEWWRATGKLATERLDLDRDREARRRFIDGGTP